MIWEITAFFYRKFALNILLLDDNKPYTPTSTGFERGKCPRIETRTIIKEHKVPDREDSSLKDLWKRCPTGRLLASLKIVLIGIHQ